MSTIGQKLPADGRREVPRTGPSADHALPAPVGETAPMRRIKWQQLLVSLVIASCVVAIGYAISLAVTGREGQGLPASIESVDPVRGARQVPAQTAIVVDLEVGYTGVLIIDGLELETVRVDEVDSATPGQQVSLPPTTLYEPGNATLTFNPSENAPITAFEQGVHVVTLVYWSLVEGRGAARSFTWTFEVF